MTGNRQPRHAATVILLRPDHDGKFELFMTRRLPHMKFLAGFYVFPGGAVTEEDASDKALERCLGLSPDAARATLEATLSSELCLAHWVAAIRELFEEAGLLLCVTEAGETVDMGDEERRKRLAEKRDALVAGAIGFTDILESERLYCDARKLAYFYHRVTPETYSMRFDARFFLGRMPENQRPLFFSEEVTETLWIAPARALELYGQGRLPLIVPTLNTLKMLGEFESWESLIRRYRLP